MGEFRRIFSRKMLLLIGAAVIINITVFLYGQMNGRSIEETVFAGKEYQWLIDRYENMSNDDAAFRSNKEYKAIRSAVKAENDSGSAELGTAIVQRELDSGEAEVIQRYNGLDEKMKVQMELEFKAVRDKITYVNGYDKDLKQILANASTFKRFKIFSDPDSFSYNNIIKTGKDFERIKDVKVSLQNDKAVDTVVHYYYIYYITFAIMIFIIYGFLTERENGIWTIVHASENGRSHMAIKRMLVVFAASFTILLLMYITTIITSFMLYGGLSDIRGPIQNISSFAKFTLPVNKIEYLGINFIASWFSIFSVSMLLCSIFVFFRNRNHTLIFTAAFVLVEILLYQKIEIQSVYNALKYINVVNLFRMNDILSKYNNWGYSVYVVAVSAFILSILGVILLISSLAAIIRYSKMRPGSNPNRISAVFNKLHKLYQKVFQYFPVTIKEIHKLLFSGKGIWVVIAVIIGTLYFSSSIKMNFTDDQIAKDEMYIEHGGSEYSYIIQYSEEKTQEYKIAAVELSEMYEKYIQGTIDFDVYYKTVTKVNYYRDLMGSVAEYIEKNDYLNKLHEEKGIDGYMMSDRGYEEMFGQYSSQRELLLLLALATGIMIVISESVSMEYRTGMENIVRSCERGRTWLMVRKTIACTLFTIILFAIVYGIDYWYLYHNYGMPFLDAPVQSLMFMENCVFKVTVLQWIFITLIIKLIICIAVMILAMIVSRIIGKKGNRALMPMTLAFTIFVIIALNKIGGVI